MTEATQNVTMKGNPVTLVGNEVRVGQAAPDVTLIANDLSEMKLSSFKGKKIILSVVPSLDTPVCDMQTKKFNDEVGKLGEDALVLTVSMDLPFAQKRWCTSAGALSENLKVLSDHRDASFGEAFGVLIKGARLLARAIFLIDRNGIVQYKQLVPEITSEPNYIEALEAFKKI